MKHLKRAFHLTTITAAMVILQACAGGMRVGAEAGNPSNNESVLVIGISTPRAQLTLMEGTRDGTRFQPATNADLRVVDVAQNGYMVVRVPGNKHYAVTFMEFDDTPPHDPAVAARPTPVIRQYTPCGGAEMPGFYVPANATVYAGDLDVSSSAPGGIYSTIRYTHRSDLAAATSHLRARYKNITQPLAPTQLERVAITTACPPPQARNIYVPIYIPRR